MISKTKEKNRIILEMDSHGLTAMQLCARKYWYDSVEHLKPRGSKKCFRTGTFIHDVLFRLNRLRLRQIDGKVPFGKEIEIRDLITLGFKAISRNKHFTQEEKVFHQAKFMEFMSMQQVDYSWLKPMGAEVGFSKVLYEDRDVRFLYSGRIDFIGRVEPANILAWVDYKTQSREYALYGNPNQFLGYSWALGTNLGYVQYYGLQKGSKNASRAELEKERKKSFKIVPISHHPALINQWQQDSIRTFRRVAGQLPFGITAFERNRSACTASKFGNCQFLKICDNEWAGKDVLYNIKKMNFKVEPWSPWDSKEIEEIEEES